MTAVEKIVCYSEFPRGRGTAHRAGKQREAPGWVRRPRSRRQRSGAFAMDSWEETGEAGYTGVELAGLNNVTGLWGRGALLSCLIPAWQD